jgi:putative pyruvate formate lyase activating enzyme
MCGADRSDVRLPFCGVGERALVSSAQPHFGEEPPITGHSGSGTIFFAGCNLRCWFCQNSDISHGRAGHEVSAEELAEIMVRLQQIGCHNVNLVSPSHVIPQIIAALAIAAGAGLRVPLVYNSGGYDSVAMLQWLDGIVDIYMPDLKYAETDPARRLSGAGDYPEVARQALKEMHRQVGDLELDPHGVARRGLLVRHLVLPNDQAGTEACMRYLAEEISPHTYINVMAQYRPVFKAHRRPEVNRRPTLSEFEKALDSARNAGLYRFAR